MNSSNGHTARGLQFNGSGPQKCVICGDPVPEQSFCKLHRKDGETIKLCCPDCTVQYLNSARPPADAAEAELRAYEKSSYFFIGENKPWS